MAEPAFRPFISAEVYPGREAETDEDIIEFACRNAKTDYLRSKRAGWLRQMTTTLSSIPSRG